MERTAGASEASAAFRHRWWCSSTDSFLSVGQGSHDARAKEQAAWSNLGLAEAGESAGNGIAMSMVGDASLYDDMVY